MRPGRRVSRQSYPVASEPRRDGGTVMLVEPRRREQRRQLRFGKPGGVDRGGVLAERGRIGGGGCVAAGSAASAAMQRRRARPAESVGWRSASVEGSQSLVRPNRVDQCQRRDAGRYYTLVDSIAMPPPHEWPRMWQAVQPERSRQRGEIGGVELDAGGSGGRWNRVRHVRAGRRRSAAARRQAATAPARAVCGRRSGRRSHRAAESSRSPDHRSRKRQTVRLVP